MAAGVPVISTAVGAEGLNITPGKDILLAAAADAWLSHLTALSRQDALWSSLASAGKAYAARYDWDLLGRSLCATYSSWFHARAAGAGAGGN
jgi:glycosyltransferase involved in cell wall biosynthesis